VTIPLQNGHLATLRALAITSICARRYTLHRVTSGGSRRRLLRVKAGRRLREENQKDHDRQRAALARRRREHPAIAGAREASVELRESEPPGSRVPAAHPHLSQGLTRAAYRLGISVISWRVVTISVDGGVVQGAAYAASCSLSSMRVLGRSGDAVRREVTESLIRSATTRGSRRHKTASAGTPLTSAQTTSAQVYQCISLPCICWPDQGAQIVESLMTNATT
jgi:hypothetical protein